MLGKRILSLIMLSSIVLIIGAGCAKPSTSEKDAIQKETESTEVQAQDENTEKVDVTNTTSRETEVKDFPENVPLPDEYIVLVDQSMGSLRQIVLETNEDIESMIARFNEIILATGGEIGLEEEIDEETGVFSAAISYTNNDGIFLAIAISKYDEEGALVKGNTGSVSYTIY